jgi:protein-S-isoprenylcysteine O-methyltransferase Ste14
MKLSLLVPLISFFWVGSEIFLGLCRRAEDKAAQKLDRASLRFLWVTIAVSVIIGVAAGVKRVGYVDNVGARLSVIGIAILVTGLLIRWAAIFTLRRYFTSNVAIIEGHRIIDRGMYRYVRHPAYAGSLLSFIGLGLSFSSWISPIIMVIPIFMAFHYRIRVEEDALTRAFGDDYREYMKRTKRLIPGIY